MDTLTAPTFAATPLPGWHLQAIVQGGTGAAPDVARRVSPFRNRDRALGPYLNAIVDRAMGASIA